MEESSLPEPQFRVDTSRWHFVREVPEGNIPFHLRKALATIMINKAWSDRPQLRVVAVEFIESRQTGWIGIVVWFNEKVDEKIYWADECDPELPQNKGKLILPFVMKRSDLKKGEVGLI